MECEVCNGKNIATSLTNATLGIDVKEQALATVSLDPMIRIFSNRNHIYQCAAFLTLAFNSKHDCATEQPDWAVSVTVHSVVLTSMDWNIDSENKL